MATNEIRPTSDTGPAPEGSCRPSRALCGWSPPARPADTTVARRVDRYVLGNAAALLVLVLVVALLNLAPHLPGRAGLAADAAAALVAGGWCSLNFWRCRHAHCLVTGPGWTALGAFTGVEAAIGHSLVGGHEEPAFLAILAAALLFEVAWRLTRRTGAVSTQ